MSVCKSVSNMPSFKAELDERRFLWCLTKDWVTVKKDGSDFGEFWTQQERTLKEFDARNPGRHRPAFPPNKRPVLPSE